VGSGEGVGARSPLPGRGRRPRPPQGGSASGRFGAGGGTPPSTWAGMRARSTRQPAERALAPPLRERPALVVGRGATNGGRPARRVAAATRRAGRGRRARHEPGGAAPTRRSGKPRSGIPCRGRRPRARGGGPRAGGVRCCPQSPAERGPSEARGSNAA
jgi:hypothetical protein